MQVYSIFNVQLICPSQNVCGIIPLSGYMIKSASLDVAVEKCQTSPHPRTAVTPQGSSLGKFHSVGEDYPI